MICQECGETPCSCTIPVYIGWDPREDLAYQVCSSSLRRHATQPLYIKKISAYDLSWPGQDGVYTRDWYQRGTQKYDKIDGKPFSTDFSFARFMVPTLMQYEGWALFHDCDFYWRDDVSKLWSLRDDDYAVMVVKHDYRPRDAVKMDGQKQEPYPRKNWSSLILWNCGHEANRSLTRNAVNSEDGSWLHGFRWLDDSLIGSLPECWNWLEGHSTSSDPKAVHFTRGGPWWTDYMDVPFSEEWRKERERV